MFKPFMAMMMEIMDNFLGKYLSKCLHIERKKKVLKISECFFFSTKLSSRSGWSAVIDFWSDSNEFIPINQPGILLIRFTPMRRAMQNRNKLVKAKKKLDEIYKATERADMVYRLSNLLGIVNKYTFLNMFNFSMSPAFVMNCTYFFRVQILTGSMIVQYKLNRSK